MWAILAQLSDYLILQRSCRHPTRDSRQLWDLPGSRLYSKRIVQYVDLHQPPQPSHHASSPANDVIHMWFYIFIFTSQSNEFQSQWFCDLMKWKVVLSVKFKLTVAYIRILCKRNQLMNNWVNLLGSKCKWSLWTTLIVWLIYLPFQSQSMNCFEILS